MTRVTALLLALAALAPAAALFASTPTPTARSAAKQPTLSLSAQRGAAFAQARCAGCHGVTRNAGSPNPESPPFEDIVNKPGLTRTTLRVFLRDSHNYPAAMNFTIERRQIGDLADYMLTLKSRSYRPGI
jgi:mono/diheme cytochrome c family protein